MKREQRVQSILERASKLPQEMREAFLREECSDDPQLIDEVNIRLSREFDESVVSRQRTIRSKESEGPHGSSSTSQAATTPMDDGSERKTLGPYVIQRILGEGGFGQVFVAFQKTPVRRQVALKILKPGMDSASVLARFAAERQALAMMDHPNVAKVFDAGTTDDGRPYFVMEYIDGLPITFHCDRHRLSIRARLELFRDVCAGVQHAHQKAIIHRDLKPSNILVVMRDDRPIPKIIDFGIAKALAPIMDDPVLTQAGQIIGTPAYMSPEQAEPSVQSIDTRSDVYSLGAILYELLSGAPPFDPQELRRAGYAGLYRLLRDSAPPRPSTRVASLGQVKTPTLDRPVDGTRLQGILRGELDWIAMKALEKEPSRRYDSPSLLSEDLARYLRDDPVQARPASHGYRLSKFVRRHKSGVSVAALFLAVLLGSTVLTAIQNRRIAAERDRANQEAAVAERTSRFLVDMFEVADPGEQRGRTITAEEILGRGADRIREELVEQPMVRARLMATLGDVYQNLGIYGRADSLLRQVLELRSAELGPEHPESAIALANLASIDHELGRYDESRQSFEQALSVLERERPRRDLEIARIRTSYGALLRSQDELAAAGEHLQAALETKRRILGPDDPAVATTVNNLAGVRFQQSRYDEALDLYEQALEIKKRDLGSGHPQIASGLSNLAITCREMSDYDRAESLLQEAAVIQRQTLGPAHPDLARTLHTLGGIQRVRGDLQPARKSLERAVEIYEANYGSSHPAMASVLDDLGILTRTSGDIDRAREIQEQALRVRESALGPDHTEVGKSLVNLAKTYSAEGFHDEAIRLYERSLRIYRKAVGDEHPYVALLTNNIGDVLRKMGHPEQARARYEQAMRILRVALGPTHPNLGVIVHNLALLDRDAGKPESAEQGFLRADSLAVAGWGPQNSFVAENAEEYAKLLRALDRGAEAESLEARAQRIRGAEAVAGD